MSEALYVRNVTGRYPHRARGLDSDNIEVRIEEIASIYRIRIDDTTPGHEDMWLEITVEVDTAQSE